MTKNKDTTFFENKILEFMVAGDPMRSYLSFFVTEKKQREQALNAGCSRILLDILSKFRSHKLGGEYLVI